MQRTNLLSSLQTDLSVVDNAAEKSAGAFLMWLGFWTLLWSINLLKSAWLALYYLLESTKNIRSPAHVYSQNIASTDRKTARHSLTLFDLVDILKFLFTVVITEDTDLNQLFTMKELPSIYKFQKANPAGAFFFWPIFDCTVESNKCGSFVTLSFRIFQNSQNNCLHHYLHFQSKRFISYFVFFFHATDSWGFR